MKKALLSFLVVMLLTFGLVIRADAAMYLLKNFRLHAFDAMIVEMLNVDDATILYWKEMGSISYEEQKIRKDYETIGCNPFYVMRGGKVDELGYNCRTFVCVGYSKGPKQCKTTEGKAYGGVVEINRRFQTPWSPPKKKYFTEFTGADRTNQMQLRIDRLADIRCKPYYLVEFKDVAVAEGYECEEIGDYPYYSARNDCLNDWREGNEYVCETPIRANEYDLRLEAIEYRGGGSRSSTSSSDTSSSDDSSSSSSSESSSESSSTSSEPSVTFSDVPSIHSAYVAITALADRGVIRGFPDGTFKPARTVTRAEMMKILMAGLHPEQVLGESRCFPDVADDWYAQFVCAAKRLKWVEGYGDGTFKPGSTVKRAEAIKMIVSSLPGPDRPTAITLPRDVPADSWYAQYVGKAIYYGIIDQSPFRPGAPLTRSDTALWVHAGMK